MNAAPKGGTRRCVIHGFTGLDRLLWALPFKLGYRAIARHVIKGAGAPTGAPNDLTMTLPDGCIYEILDECGNFKPWSAP